MNATASELDFTLTRYEGWRTFAETPPRRQPPRKSSKELAKLGRREAALYADERAVWHANLGPFITPQMHHVMDEITELLESNRQDTYKAKTSAVIDAYPGLGKTTLAMHIGRQFHRHQIDLFGEQTSDGDQRIPVAYIPLAGRTTIRTMNIMLCDFYGLPTAGNSADLGRRAANAACRSQTRLIVVDDTHFLNMRTSAGREVSNHLKWLSSEFPVTFLFVGVDLLGSGLLTEGLMPGKHVQAQTSRRWTRYTLSRFTLADNNERKVWITLLKTIEKHLVLANLREGTLERLADYLYTRSSGHFSSLMAIITRACHRAVRNGDETLTRALIDGIKNDQAAEDARRTLAADMTAGRLTTAIR